jgi:hypothetical protein
MKHMHTEVFALSKKSGKRFPPHGSAVNEKCSMLHKIGLAVARHAVVAVYTQLCYKGIIVH